MRKAVVLGLLVSLFSAIAIGQSSTYTDEVNKWRADHQKELLADDGWFTVAGLFWLKAGVNTVGSGEGYDVQLTSSFTHGKFGEINFTGSKVILRVADGVEAVSSGKRVTSLALDPGANGKPPVVQIGSQSFFLIEREGKFGIRLKDKNNPSRTNFHGLKWYDIDPAYHVTATLESFAEPKEVLIPNVLGSTFKMKSLGILHFKLLGKDVSVQPVEDEGKLFIIFRDATSKSETYGAGRFLYAEQPVDGKVTLDFNQAENPPCAFTEFATCPLPPPQNRLDVEIKAGEKRYHD
ncbi:MAG: DUF1684 domain-containing protein [Acidobacteriota bacterium]